MAQPQVAQLIGGAGTGKTRALMDVLDKAVEQLADPHLVGFCSFTRAACDEAADRASERFGLHRNELRQQGWFRTVHGVAHKCLGVGKELLTDDRESKRWLEDAMQEDAQDAARTLSNDEEGFDLYDGTKTASARVLNLWHASRNRLRPFREAWADASACDDRTPDYEECVASVERYEQAKRLDGRIDFVDLLGRFAGYRFHVDGASRVSPQGEPPRLDAWIHDEMQDSSPLLDSCFRRMIEVDTVRWVYLAGDPFQSVYRWNGSDHRCFMDGYPIAKRRVMPKSWRCSEKILRLGEEILEDCADYWDRGIEPAREGGEIILEYYPNSWERTIDPRKQWLLLARTNFQANRLIDRLDRAGVPWLPTKKDQGCRWKAPTRNTAIRALMAIQAGGPVDGSEWQAILKQLPSRLDGIELFRNGTKARFALMTEKAAQGAYPWVLPGELETIGATPAFAVLVSTGQWKEHVEHAEQYATAVAEWGQEAVDNPGVRIGTVHSAKGLEADNVVLLTTTSAPCSRAEQTDEGADEETRVKYVAVTRAKHKLVLLREKNVPFAWSLPKCQ